MGNWYEPDYEDLKRQMLHVFENKDEAQERGRVAAGIIRKDWTFEKTAEQIVKVIESVTQN